MIANVTVESRTSNHPKIYQSGSNRRAAVNGLFGVPIAHPRLNVVSRGIGLEKHQELTASRLDGPIHSVMQSRYAE